LYVQTPREAADRIPLAAQRHLINNFKLATQLSAEVVQVQARNVPQAILDVATQWQVTTVCIGKPHFSLLRIILNTWIFNELLNRLSESEEDLIVLS